MFLGSLASPALGVFGFALWVAGIVICWHILRTNQTLSRGQKKTFKMGFCLWCFRSFVNPYYFCDHVVSLL